MKTIELPPVWRGQVWRYWARHEDDVTGALTPLANYALRLAVRDAAGAVLQVTGVSSSFQFEGDLSAQPAYRLEMSEAQTAALAAGVAELALWMVVGADDVGVDTKTNLTLPVFSKPGAPS